jgi:hypothetical protein
VNHPGPVVVGATQGAACFGGAYEFVFNVAYHLKKQKLKVPVSYVSAEPFAGHFGIGGLPGGEKRLPEDTFGPHRTLGRRPWPFTTYLHPRFLIISRRWTRGI